MTDWALPTLTSTYEDVIDVLKDRDKKNATMNYSGDTNVVLNTIQFSSANSRFEIWNGSAWVALDSLYDMAVSSAENAGNATTLASQAASFYLSCANFTDTLADARIPSLNASKTNAGTFEDARIPSLAASKITSGVFDAERIPAPAAVGSYVSAQNMYFRTNGGNTTGFTFTTSVAFNTTESVGPTGSGAANIWTALNELPAGTKAIFVGIYMTVQANDSDSCGMTLYAADGDVSSITGTTSVISYIKGESSASDDFGTGNTAWIPLNATNRFALEWATEGGPGSQFGQIYLKGFAT